MSERSCDFRADPAALRDFAAGIRRATIEEVAQFVETHYCVIDWERGPGFYKTEIRLSKHPKEPLAMAIRGLAGEETLRGST